MRSDPPYSPIVRELQDHRVSEPEPPDLAVADDNSHAAVAHLVAPTQPAHAAVNRGQQNTKVIRPAEHHPAGERRNQLDVRGERLHQPVDVIRLGGPRVSHYGVIYTHYGVIYTHYGFIHTDILPQSRPRTHRVRASCLLLRS